MNDIAKVMAEGTMKALALHASDKGIEVTDSILAKARQIVHNEWDEMMETAKNALDARMGESTYKHVLNVYCNSWAVKALKS